MNKPNEQQVEQVVPNNVSHLRELDTLKRDVANAGAMVRDLEEQAAELKRNFDKLRDAYRTRNRDYLEVNAYCDRLQEALAAWTAFGEACVSEAVHNLPAFKAAKAATIKAAENAPW